MRVKVQTDEEIKESARSLFRAMLARKSLVERGMPLLAEAIWIVKGQQNDAEHERILPEYCYKTIELLRGHVFKILPTFAQVFGGRSADSPAIHGSTDWEKLGALIGAAMRSLRFAEVEANQEIPETSRTDFGKIAAEELRKWKANADEVRKTVETLGMAVRGFQHEADKSAYHQGPEAMALLAKGFAEGVKASLDEKGIPPGMRELKLIKTYRFLLIAWPEIDEMIRAQPPKTRNDLWSWLTPFSQANWVEISDLEQLNRTCESIGLKLKGPGAPRKQI